MKHCINRSEENRMPQDMCSTVKKSNTFLAHYPTIPKTSNQNQTGSELDDRLLRYSHLKLSLRCDIGRSSVGRQYTYTDVIYSSSSTLYERRAPREKIRQYIWLSLENMAPYARYAIKSLWISDGRINHRYNKYEFDVHKICKSHRAVLKITSGLYLFFIRSFARPFVISQAYRPIRPMQLHARLNTAANVLSK